MTSHIYWHLELAIKEGHLEDWKKLMSEMVQDTQKNEPNTLNYEWWINEDNTKSHIYERYSDSAAVMVHMANFGAKYAERFFTFAHAERFVIYGDPSNEIVEAMQDMMPIYMKALGGFGR